MDYIEYMIADFMSRLEGAAEYDDFYEISCMVVEDMAGNEESSELVEPVIRFIEEHPHLPFGNPGPLVHFVEEYYQQGYEPLLMESVKRCPTPHTLWMLTHLIYAEDDPNHDNYVALLRDTAARSDLDEATRQAADKYIKHIDGEQGVSQ